jgi:DNA-binding beta-propeller fold protein YncE
MYPSGLEWDSRNDRIVVADTGRNRISFYSLKGKRLGGFGRFGHGNGEFDTPRDVAVDNRGRIYVADAANHRVQAFTAKGKFRWATPGVGTCPLCLNTPIGVTWDSENNALLVASTGQDRIKSFSAGGGFRWQTDPGTSIGFDAPRDVARHEGMLWVVDYVGHRIAVYDDDDDGSLPGSPDFALGPSTGGPPIRLPYNIAFSPNGDLAYVSSTANSHVSVWDISGAPTWIRQIGSRCTSLTCEPQQPPDDKIEDLRRVAVADNGRVITADFWGNGLKVFLPSGGDAERDIGGRSAPRRGVAEAFGVDVGSNGTVYVADRLNQQIEWYTASGSFRGTAGSRDDISWPEAVAGAGNQAWIADTRGGDVELWNLNANPPAQVEVVPLGGGGFSAYIHDVDLASGGDVFAVAGQPGPPDQRHVFRIDGTTHNVTTVGPQFADPQGVAVTGRFIYVADAGSNDIVKLRRSDGFEVRRTSIRLHGPQGVDVAPNGHVWVADTNANRIVHLNRGLGLVETHKPRKGKALDLPHTLAVSPNGNWLFVADTFNNRVLRFRI